MGRRRSLLLIAALLGPACASADTGLPLWEAGLAAGAGVVPDYPGADRSTPRGLVLPILIYRGPALRVDGDGIRGRLARSGDWEFGLTATGGFDAHDSPARAGMPALDWLAGAGPQWIYQGWQRRGGPTLHLRLRALVSSDLRRVDGRGFSVDPALRWRFDGVAGTRTSLTWSLEPTWATAALHRYFYEVTPAQATAARPAYAARGGYLGTELGATWGGQPAAGLSWFVTARAMSMHGAANAGSPLLRERGQVSVGAGLVWTPWRSGRRAVE